MSQTFYSIHDYYISHHGVKGQKWGVRRYRNEDGTLTEAGKKRYEKEFSKDKGKYIHNIYEPQVNKNGVLTGYKEVRRFSTAPMAQRQRAKNAMQFVSAGVLASSAAGIGASGTDTKLAIGTGIASAVMLSSAILNSVKLDKRVREQVRRRAIDIGKVPLSDIDKDRFDTGDSAVNPYTRRR